MKAKMHHVDTRSRIATVIELFVEGYIERKGITTDNYIFSLTCFEDDFVKIKILQEGKNDIVEEFPMHIIMHNKRLVEVVESFQKADIGIESIWVKMNKGRLVEIILNKVKNKEILTKEECLKRIERAEKVIKIRNQSINDDINTLKRIQAGEVVTNSSGLEISEDTVLNKINYSKRVIKEYQRQIRQYKAQYQSLKEKEKQRVCPICGKTYYNAPALSRKDNKTEICPECGMLEALASFNKNENS